MISTYHNQMIRLREHLRKAVKVDQRHRPLKSSVVAQKSRFLTTYVLQVAISRTIVLYSRSCPLSCDDSFSNMSSVSGICTSHASFTDVVPVAMVLQDLDLNGVLGS